MQNPIQEAINRLLQRENLNFTLAQNVMNEIMEGKVSQVQMAAYLSLLSAKGESIEEITASALSMRAHSLKLEHDFDVLEIVGTGGDGSNSFNISTTSSFIIAASGVKVAKHGNRAASSKSGAADVLEALGVNILLSPAQSLELLKKINICFLFAQTYHSAMKYVAPVRKELGIKSIFNLLGPLSNPANAQFQLMGVYEKSLVEPLAKVLSNLGVTRAMVVHGLDCLDEISLSAKTFVCEVDCGKFTSYEISPRDVGYSFCDKSALIGGNPQENAKITREILSAKDKGAKRESVCLNAGAALYIAKRAESLEQGVRLAESLIDSGKAEAKLEQFISQSNAI
ncbi:anthranilate phosphoribosyltransferase [Helicobacter sp. MIT 00-7814]|uniref:anthranilate phosphoribosyltransferase n=1 Tax=unclassified Helicobacter TaxID=2593540 RepID=UPI000E1F3DBB|nr:MULTISPECIES: anthranilate phosphoribosyltransferase [unclassified Helicobacter]RDU52823.1 anthranilate phosphoribosyltransferase [Helicobacter sp. MIT 99-10781]RDU53238.1 anthranilate phosphoribosyltransferase [Helicobacter sp. MIT 00-7814]